MKFELPSTSTIIALMFAGLALGSSIRTEYKHQKEMEILEHYIQMQQEIICLNANSLPIQFQEHKEACYGVEGSIMLRHQ
ncbi:hypothetical protein [Aeromonas caviae]|uniref:hypothetical protein n=1 Tax=Aeromonas caviae TaxID=648 RepID=UPI002B48B8B7|nr:hypothetical protein [Aeromonas caviae]